MGIEFADVDNEYSKNPKLKKDDVRALLDWAHKQQHLPKITELQAILFLQSCYYRNEVAKTAIDNFFTLRTHFPELFRKYPVTAALQKNLNNSLGTILPKKTPEGYNIIFLRLMSTNTENFNFIEHIKYFDLACMAKLYQEGTSKGYIIVCDLQGAQFGHLTKAAMAGPMVMKRFLFYLQEAMPLRLKGLHFVNIVSFIDKILALIKPFVKIEVFNMLQLHNTVEDLAKFVPLECLPEEYGGGVSSTKILHENIKKQILTNDELHQWEDQQVVDENKRLTKFKEDGIFGTEGTFKKLEID